MSGAASSSVAPAGVKGGKGGVSPLQNEEGEVHPSASRPRKMQKRLEMQALGPRSLAVQVSDVSLAPTELDTPSENEDDGGGSVALVENGAGGVSLALDFGVELPMAEEDTQFTDEFGRMNGSSCSFHYDDPPCVPISVAHSRPRSVARSRPRSVARSHSPPMDAKRRCAGVLPQLVVAYPHQPPARPAQARSSAFGGGFLVANHADCDVVYNRIARRI